MKQAKEVLEQLLFEHWFPISYWLSPGNCITWEQAEGAALQGDLSQVPGVMVGQCHTDGVPSYRAQ